MVVCEKYTKVTARRVTGWVGENGRRAAVAGGTREGQGEGRQGCYLARGEIGTGGGHLTLSLSPALARRRGDASHPGPAEAAAAGCTMTHLPANPKAATTDTNTVTVTRKQYNPKSLMHHGCERGRLISNNNAHHTPHIRH